MASSWLSTAHYFNITGVHAYTAKLAPCIGTKSACKLLFQTLQLAAELGILTACHADDSTARNSLRCHVRTVPCCKNTRTAEPLNAAHPLSIKISMRKPRRT